MIADPHTRETRRRRHLVRPRLVWGGTGLNLAGIVVLGIGVVMLSLVVSIIGVALIVAGSVISLAGGVMYDAVSTPDLHGELRQARHGEVHEGVAPRDMLRTARVRRDASATSRSTDALLAAGQSSNLRFAPLAGWIIVAAAAFLALRQPWSPFSSTSHDSSLRDTGLAIATAIAGLRIALTPGRHLVAAAVALLAGIVLLLSALFAPHDITAVAVDEVTCGVLIVLASFGTLLESRDSDG